MGGVCTWVLTLACETRQTGSKDGMLTYFRDININLLSGRDININNLLSSRGNRQLFFCDINMSV
jgi:hypothetical protein